MKKLAALAAGGLFCLSAIGAETSLVSLVNPLQGTDDPVNFSHGNEYPAIALPFPMNVWAPYTEPEGNPLFYQYRHNQFRGLRQTHEPSRWIGDYANFSLMPVSGKLVVTENERASTFRHENEIAQPSYYKVHLDTWNATAEVTPTERAARLRFTFESPADAYVVLDVFGTKRISSLKIIPAENKIIGVTRNYHGRSGVGVPENFGNYFVIVFDRPFTASGVWSSNAISPGVTNIEGAQALGAFLKFDITADHVVGCKVASSFISAEQAVRNLDREIGGADFDTIRSRAETRWNEMLGRAKVTGGTDDQRRVFYSALYRSTLFPHRFYEFDAGNKPVYFSPYDGKVHSGHLYTDSGFWDTFRAAHPLINLLYPEIGGEVLEGLVHAYDESGWLPSWSCPAHLECMIGNHAFSLLADGWMKGIRTFDANHAVAAMVHDANTQSPGNCRSIGRDGADFYNKLGYVPYSKVPGDKQSFREAGAKTLEFAYDDFCAAQLAHAIGKNTEAETFARHAMNYTNLFDTTTGFMRGRKADGLWDEPFYPDEWGGPFTEGNSWQWTWSVMQDEPGLMSLMGGATNYAAKLDAVFSTAPTVRPGTYGGMIHEMIEMVSADMGQYAHGNEPVHHMIYLYDYAGQPWKAQSRIRQTMALLYQNTPDGMCGDEDTGQMSAWYVFSALGFYPACPGDPQYLIGSPLFDKTVLSLPGGKTFTITARNNGPQQPYVQNAKLNGANFDQTFISHQAIVNGGELIFQMDAAPNYNWGVSPKSRPVSPLATLFETGAK
ncbi:MAG: GH92 family glycosyl hydrolase [Verrucomicrobiae bacterium]|nr:GH92 family glycosyl hydrolase [Verrucomicrobiae bacterium]